MREAMMMVMMMALKVSMMVVAIPITVASVEAMIRAYRISSNSAVGKALVKAVKAKGEISAALHASNVDRLVTSPVIVMVVVQAASKVLSSLRGRARVARARAKVAVNVEGAVKEREKARRRAKARAKARGARIRKAQKLARRKAR